MEARQESFMTREIERARTSSRRDFEDMAEDDIRSGIRPL
jgi:hypothetical protein